MRGLALLIAGLSILAGSIFALCVVLDWMEGASRVAFWLDGMGFLGFGVLPIGVGVFLLKACTGATKGKAAQGKRPEKKDRSTRPQPGLAVICLGVVAIFVACGGSWWKLQGNIGADGATEETLEDDGHQRMLDMLKHFADNPPLNHPVAGDLGAPKLRAVLEAHERAAPGRKLSNIELWNVCSQLGQAEVRLGNVEEGIAHLRQAYELLSDLGADEERQQRCALETQFYLGVAYMRLGEDQNCCLRHSSDSCIVPIRGGGLHTQQDGSRNAIKYFREVLQRPPLSTQSAIQDHLAARWLLNIAYMTLDEYPDQVPDEFLIAPETFQSELEIPRFVNVAPALELDTFSLSGGAIVDDFDGDDYLDIVVSSYEHTGQMKFFRNNQDGTFSNRTREAGLTGFYGGLNMVHADYDNDGDLDIFVVRGAWISYAGRVPNSLLSNNGDGTFTDVTFDAGLGEVHYPTKTAAWADFDNDGDLDLFIANETDEAIDAPCQLFRNNGDRTFTDVAKQAGVQLSCFGMGTVFGDYDNDRYPDIFVGGPNQLFRNNRDGTFSNVSQSTGVSGPVKPFPVWFWDFNNDGALDLFVSASSGPIGILALESLGGSAATDPMIRSLREEVSIEFMHLYRNDGAGGFDEVAQESNLWYPAQPMGANFGDLDNDGYLDFYLATGDVAIHELRPNVMFLNQGGKRFVNVTMSGGFGHLQKGHGVSFADIDNDGDQDVYEQLGGAYPSDKFNDALFENPGFGNHWLTIKLEGRQSNRCAIGARIHARIVENGKERSVYRHVNSGGSFGCNPLRQTIGLGKAEQLQTLEIFWPTTGKTQTFKNVPMDQAIHIIEGEDQFTTMKLKTFRLGAPPSEWLSSEFPDRGRIADEMRRPALRRVENLAGIDAQF